ncbi:1,4-dihydroxy-2-naphthoate polyprenyltransferase [soil metagenome]
MNPYLEAARPRTLTAAVAPVIVGTAAASAWVAWRFGAALVVALAVQVAVNYANDYFDGVKGVDSEDRLGPRRAVASGLIPPPAMKRAIVICFLATGLAGLALAAATTWWLVVVGAGCFLAALGYSGGPKPYASAALGEVFVFVFFGLVATVGSAFVQDERIVHTAVIASVPVGLFAVAILVANNLRDIPTDAPAGKRTLAVVMGEGATRQLFLVLFILAFAFTGVIALSAGSWWPALALAAVPLSARPIELVLEGAEGPELIPVLAGTARAQLVFAVALTAGLVLAQVPG